MHPAHSFDFEETPVGIFFVCVAFFFLCTMGSYFFTLHFIILTWVQELAHFKGICLSSCQVLTKFMQRH